MINRNDPRLYLVWEWASWEQGWSDQFWLDHTLMPSGITSIDRGGCMTNTDESGDTTLKS